MRSSILTAKRARNLRRIMTEPEVMLWTRLRRRLPDHPVFRRQYPIGPFILDFYCPAARLAVEVDGAIHGEERQVAHDQRRDAWLREQGVTVYCTSASSVFEDADEAADAARRLADELLTARGGKRYGG
jgi:very-short-patch-repair endonuclease